MIPEKFQISLESSTSKLLIEKSDGLQLSSDAQISLIPLPSQMRASFLSFIIKYEFQERDEGAIANEEGPEESEISISVKVKDRLQGSIYSHSNLLEESFIRSLFDIVLSPESTSMLYSLGLYLLHRIFSSYPSISQQDCFQQYFLRKGFLFKSLLISEESLFSPTWNSLSIYELV
jgi:hypothetical protein